MHENRIIKRRNIIKAVYRNTHQNFYVVSGHTKKYVRKSDLIKPIIIYISGQPSFRIYCVIRPMIFLIDQFRYFEKFREYENKNFKLN
jgi:hypothetical protein